MSGTDVLWRRSPPLPDEIDGGNLGDGQVIPPTISPIMPFLSEAAATGSHSPEKFVTLPQVSYNLNKFTPWGSGTVLDPRDKKPGFCPDWLLNRKKLVKKPGF
ncbi:MAG: hypothetical protein ACRC8Y_18760 [Chroococcales cyanobacterium]